MDPKIHFGMSIYRWRGLTVTAEWWRSIAMPGDVGSERIELDVRCLNGEGCVLTLDHSTLGRSLCTAWFPSSRPREGQDLCSTHLASPPLLHQTLQEQDIVGKAATLSCSEEEIALEGVTEIGNISVESLYHLPRSLTHLTIGHHFNQSLDFVTFPSSLQSLTFGHCFHQNLDRVTFPSSLKSLTFGATLNQSLDRVTFPSSLQRLTICGGFNQSLDQATLPRSLRRIFHQSVLLRIA